MSFFTNEQSARQQPTNESSISFESSILEGESSLSLPMIDAKEEHAYSAELPDLNTLIGASGTRQDSNEIDVERFLRY